MNRIVKILMERDGMTEKEAWKLFYDVQEQVLAVNGSYSEAEDIMAAELGLEMDYIFDLIG